jgi:glycerol-3-phosphate dehydrogenase
VKGSHIVVRKLFDHPYAYIFQNPDKRIIFVIPYEEDFTLIGTTDVEIHGDPSAATIDEAETSYLCAQASRYMAKPVNRADVVWSYSGVRPLLDDASGDPSAVTRDYLLEMNDKQVPLLTIWGGKITTFRKLAEEAADMLCNALGTSKPAWTAGEFLPGGDLNDTIQMTGQPIDDFAAFLKALGQRYPWLPESLRTRYARAYGARMALLLGEAKSIQDMGAEIVPGFYEIEARYLQEHEWAETAQDMLWRRSKLGLHMTAQAREQVESWLRSRCN